MRSRPVSRFAPFSNRGKFPGLLESISIGHEFMGGPLGGRPADPTMYDSDGKPDYDRMRSLDEFQAGITKLVEMATQRRTAILCSEGDPAKCHRRLLLGPPLEDVGFRLLHIMRDGVVLSETQLAGGRGNGLQLQGELGV